MKTTLKPLSEFVDKLKDRETDVLNIIIYNNFLKQPLKLEMFIPCKDGEPLEEPDVINFNNSEDFMKAIEQYKQAKERIIFKGFKLFEYTTYMSVKNSNTSVAFNFNGNLLIKGPNGLVQDLSNKVDLTDKEYERLNLR